MKSMDLTKVKEPDSSSTESASMKNQSMIQHIPRRNKRIRPAKSTEELNKQLNDINSDNKYT